MYRQADVEKKEKIPVNNIDNFDDQVVCPAFMVSSNEAEPFSDEGADGGQDSVEKVEDEVVFTDSEPLDLFVHLNNEHVLVPNQSHFISHDYMSHESSISMWFYETISALFTCKMIYSF